MTESAPEAPGSIHFKVPGDPIEDGDVLRLIISAHDALLDIYREVTTRLEGDRLFLANLLQNDWIARSDLTLTAAKKLLERQGAGDSEIQSIEADAIAGEISSTETSLWLSALESVVSSCAVCVQLVPLGSVSPPVKALFREALEAEDQHLAHLSWLVSVAS